MPYIFAFIISCGFLKFCAYISFIILIFLISSDDNIKEYARNRINIKEYDRNRINIKEYARNRINIKEYDRNRMITINNTTGTVYTEYTTIT